MNHLSLFSGYEGFSLGMTLAGLSIRTVGYVEWNEFCQRIIQARIKDGLLNDAPIFSDISTFNGEQCRGVVGIITAGFPCQPHSAAGARLGEADERNLWPDTLRVIREVAPKFIMLENVPGILTNGYGGTVIGQLSESGYDCTWDCVSAAATGASHIRNRWWLLATNTTNNGWGDSRAILSRIYTKVVTSGGARPHQLPPYTPELPEAYLAGGVGEDDGTASWMDRVVALGNGIHPGTLARVLLTNGDVSDDTNRRQDEHTTV
jgi:site-specific DNA-cytosine methylase